MSGLDRRAPLVSVIVPVFNGAATVSRAIDSVLSQTFRDFELITIDDGSTDGSGEVLARYGAQARIVSRPNRGTSAARNAGIALSRGEYIAFLDADDVWRPEKLEKTVPALAVRPDAVLVYSAFDVVDGSGTPIDPTILTGERPNPLPSTMVIRRDSLLAVGCFDERLRSYHEDRYLCMMLSEKGAFVFVREVLASYQMADVESRLMKMERRRPETLVFERLVRERYGKKHPLANLFRRQAGQWAYLGKLALLAGERSHSRRAFRMAMRHAPWRPRYVFRYLRTFMPSRVAVAVSGKRVSADGSFASRGRPTL